MSLDLLETRKRKARHWDEFAARALAVIESAYSCPEWLRFGRTAETDALLADLGCAVRLEQELSRETSE